MKLINWDCLEYLKKIPDKSIDFVITDPPYWINIAKWDNNIPEKEYFKEIFRISKNQIIFWWNFYDLPKKDWWIIWYKQPFLKHFSEAEMIWTNFLKKTKVFHYIYAWNCEWYPWNLKVNYKKKSLHPTQKPIELMNYLIETYTKEWDLILDCFMWSWTTWVACKNTNRDFIWIELDKEYFEIAKNRIEKLCQE